MSRARRLGVIIVVSVAAWGAAAVGLGLVGALWAAVALLALAGAADAYSAVCRNTMLQTTVPDDLRGRLSAVYFMVVVGGPFLGDVEAGGIASAFSPRISIVSGGLLVMAGAAAVAAAFPALLRHRQDHA